jgi:hypothetical protein
MISTLPREFWQSTPHLFIPAHWGPQYCRCCADPKRRKIHDVRPEPATHVGNCTGYEVATKDEFGFAVTAWNDDGGACHYGMKDTFEEAMAFVDNLRKSGDFQRDGRMWQHFQIDERRYYTSVDTNVIVLETTNGGPPAIFIDPDTCPDCGTALRLEQWDDHDC